MLTKFHVGKENFFCSVMERYNHPFNVPYLQGYWYLSSHPEQNNLLKILGVWDIIIKKSVNYICRNGNFCIILSILVEKIYRKALFVA